MKTGIRIVRTKVHFEPVKAETAERLMEAPVLNIVPYRGTLKPTLIDLTGNEAPVGYQLFIGPIPNTRDNLDWRTRSVPPTLSHILNILQQFQQGLVRHERNEGWMPQYSHTRSNLAGSNQNEGQEPFSPMPYNIQSP